MTDRVLTTSRYNPTFEEWEDTELADLAKVLAWAAREHPEVLVGVVRHLPNVEEKWWCRTHDQESSHDKGRCLYSVMKLMQIRPEQVGGCRIEPVLVVPLGGDDT